VKRQNFTLLVGYLSIALSIGSCGLFGSKTDPNQPIDRLESKEPQQRFRLAFYNLENLFDTIDGPNNDADFLPDSRNAWNSERYQSKLSKLAQVIDSISPDILGVCEVENRRVLEDLVKTSTWLSSQHFSIVHKESPDKRGIDVALLYRSQQHSPNGFVVAAEEFIPVELPDTSKPTRSILKVTLSTSNNVLFDVFVNHWPSRSGGELETRKLRGIAASTIKKHITQISENTPLYRWVAVGDFNDNPTDSSMLHIWGAGNFEQSAINLGLIYRTTWPDKGTLKYKGKWDLFDQIIVSRSFYHLGPTSRMPEQTVFLRDWLLQQDGNFAGYPLRSFGGKSYLGGYSDHLPVYTDLELH